MLNLSTGLKNLQLSPMPAAMAGGAIFVYSNDEPQPTTSDLAPTGTLLAVISNNGLPWTLGSPTNGLNIVATTGGYLLPHPSQNWVLTGIADGIAGWARFISPNDTLADSRTLPRIDCAVNVGGTGLLLASPTITVGLQRPITYWLYGIPPF